MTRGALIVFLLRHGTLVFWAGAVPAFIVSFSIVRRLGSRVGAWRVRRRVRELGEPYEGELTAATGVRIEGRPVRFAQAPVVIGLAPRRGERVLVWCASAGESAEEPYRSASSVVGPDVVLVAARALEACPPARARAAALAAVLGLGLWAVAWLALGPWIASQLVIEPRGPARAALGQVLAGEASALPLAAGLMSPFMHARVRAAIGRALDAPSNDDSPTTSDAMRAVFPLLPAFSNAEVRPSARVRTRLEAADAPGAIAEAYRTNDPEARALAARAALTFGRFADAAKLAPGEPDVLLAGMTGDLGAIRDAAPTGDCVAVWASVRLGDASPRDLRDVVRAEVDGLRMEPDDPGSWLCARLLDDVSPTPIEQPLANKMYVSRGWWLLRWLEREGSPPAGPDGDFAFSFMDVRAPLEDGVSPIVLEDAVRRANVGADRAKATEELLSRYEELFGVPDECPTKTDLRYAADRFLGACTDSAAAVDPFLDAGTSDEGTWASWWQESFMTRCLAPDTRRSRVASTIHPRTRREEQCVLDEQPGSEAFWREPSLPCATIFWKQPPFTDLVRRLVRAHAIARCAGMRELDAELQRAIAAFRASYDRRSTVALLWP